MAELYITEEAWLGSPYYSIAKRLSDGSQRRVGVGWRDRVEAERALVDYQAREDRPIDQDPAFAAHGPAVHGEATYWARPNEYRLTHALYIYGSTPLSGELRPGERDGQVGFHHYVWPGANNGENYHCFFSEQPIVDQAMAQHEALDAGDPMVQAYLQDRLPCEQRGYHRCDDCGIRVPLDQVGKSALVLGWCVQCKVDLYPQRTPFQYEAEMARRQMESAAESRRLGDREG